MIDWDEDKDVWLRNNRALSFEAAKVEIESGRVIAVYPNHNYPGQVIFIIMIDNYTCVCPATPNESGFFLHTLYRSRKFHKLFNGGAL